MDTRVEMKARHEAMLSEVADLSLTLARDLHARALAARDEKSANDLALAFQRVTRSLRQTLALEARLERDHRLAAREAAQDLARETLDRVQKKRAHVRRAIAPLAWTEHEGDEAEALLEEMESFVFELSEEDGFLDAPIEVLIEKVLEAFGLPADEDGTDAETSETVRRSSA